MRMPSAPSLQRRLHRALHGAAEGNAALQLLGNPFGDQRGVEFRLPDLDDVEEHFAVGELRQVLAELVDVRALLADQDARPRGVHGHPALLVRTLDDDLGDAGLPPLLHDEVTHLEVLVEELRVLAAACVPARVPGAVDADTKADRIDFLTHRQAPFFSAICFFVHDDGQHREEPLDP